VPALRVALDFRGGLDRCFARGGSCEDHWKQLSPGDGDQRRVARRQAAVAGDDAAAPWDLKSKSCCARVPKKKIMGDLNHFKTLSAAGKTAEDFCAEINAKRDRVGDPVRSELGWLSEMSMSRWRRAASSRKPTDHA